LIATLIYLTIQIRQIRDTVRDNNFSIQSDRAIRHSHFAAGTPGFMTVFRKGCENLDQLSDDERWIFGTYMYALFQGFQESYHLHRAGLMQDFQWEQMRNSTVVYLRRPRGRRWWESGRDMLDGSFVAYIDEALS
jgi:hypothetical protein